MASAVIASRKHNINLPKIDFIRESSDEVDADLRFDEHIKGLCEGWGNHIYLLHGLRPKDLARTTAHEVRHSWQKQTRHYSVDYERDVRLYEREFLLNLGDPSDETVIRTLADVCDQLRSTDETNIKKMREKMIWQENLLKKLLRENDSSKSQMAALGESVAAIKAEIARRESELANIF